MSGCLNESTVFCFGMALAAINLAVSIATFNPYLMAMGIAAVLLISITYKLWYLLEPVLIRKTNIVEIIGGYELSGTRSTAVRKVGNRFYATAAAELNPSKAEIDGKRIEEIISRSNTPFKFILQLERLNSKKMTENLQTKRGMKEIALSKLSSGSTGNTQKVNLLKREIEQLDRDIHSISSGSCPVRLIQYILSSSHAESRYVAEEKARSQVREMAGQFGSLIDAQPRVLEGAELLELLSIDSMVIK